MPTEYISVKYSVTPPGASTGDTPLVLTVGPAPVASGKTCFRTQNQIYLYARSGNGVAEVTISLTDTATRPNQVALQASNQTLGVAQVDLKLPLVMDRDGNLANSVRFSTSTNPLICYLNLGGPDLFASLDGDFTCESLSSETGSKLSLTEGRFHAVPCPP